MPAGKQIILLTLRHSKNKPNIQIGAPWSKKLLKICIKIYGGRWYSKWWPESMHNKI